jgi:hypothetical protein
MSKETTYLKTNSDEDHCSEVFLDIEKGETKKTDTQNEKTKEQKDEENTSLSITNLYDQDNSKETDHFAHKLAMELEHIKTQQEAQKLKNSIKRNTENEDHYFSNSPLTMSLCSSHCHSDYEDSIDDGTDGSKKNAFKKLTYEEVERSLNRHYTRESQISSEIDILLTYLKGQKHIFKQSSRITEQKFNFLMFPAIFITGTMTVVTPFTASIGWSGWAMSILNALLTVMITINNFMKWQAVAAIYMTMSNQYDKLGISVEMSRNQYMFVENFEERNKMILEKMRDTEKRIMDIQYNYNDIIVPYEIQLMNPVISHINIFSFIKKIENHKKSLIVKYKDIKNEIRYMMYKWEKEQQTYSEVHNFERNPEELDKMHRMLKTKEEVKLLLVQNSSSVVYSYIDNLFVREIQHSEHYYTYRSAGMYIIFRPKPMDRFTCGNPVVDDYLNFIFTDGNEIKTSIL